MIEAELLWFVFFKGNENWKLMKKVHKMTALMGLYCKKQVKKSNPANLTFFKYQYEDIANF